MSPAPDPAPPAARARWLSRLDSLTTRTILVVLVGIGLVHLVSLWTYNHSLTREAEQASDVRLADRLLGIKRAVMRAQPAERDAIAHDLSGGPFEAHWSRTEHATPGGPGAEAWTTLGQRLRELEPELAQDGLVIGANRRAPDDPHLAIVSMRLPDQSWVNVSLVVSGSRPANAHGTLLSTSLMALGALGLSILLVRWLTRPFSTFAEAAKSFYRTRDVTPVPESGPREVRDLAAAFNDMQRRIASLIDDRTQALAAVSHDLKTPITRLRFRAEEVPDEATRNAIAADLDDMERMIDQTLAFLRGDRAEEDLHPVDLVAILQSITDDFSDTGRPVTLTGAGTAVLPGRRLALKRAFGNLVENAVKYGGAAEVLVSKRGGTVEVVVADRGPGIAETDIEHALAPFVRLEPSRNPQTGGFGLGLPIARAIIEGHGGGLRLASRIGGGLAVHVTLPATAPGD